MEKLENTLQKEKDSLQKAKNKSTSEKNINTKLDMQATQVYDAKATKVALKKETEEKHTNQILKENLDNTLKTSSEFVGNSQKTEIPEQQQLQKYKKNNKNKIIILSAIIVAILIILVVSTVFGIATKNSNKIISGISVNGIDISNLTKSEALDKLDLNLKDTLNKELTFTRKDYSSKIDSKEIEAYYNLEESVDNAFNYGRSKNNIFSNNFEVLKIKFSHKTITPAIGFNDSLLDEKIEKINKELPDRVENSSYRIEDNKLIISNSTNGFRIKNDLFKNNIINALSTDTSAIEIPVEEYQADKIDIDAIYNNIHKEPINATFTASPFEIKKEEEGLDFAISLEEAKKIVEEEQESYTIPLKVLKPSVTVKSLPKEAFPDELASYSTTYASSNYNRSTNISLAAKSVNGWVLMPGEVFSYNGALGQRTTAKGYKEAGAYVNGQVTTDVGGGICQVSSTLYNAALLCNLEIVDRINHTFEPSYVPAGQDATVSWKSPDFKFKNNRAYPIRISATAGNGRVSFSINGVKSADDYQVKIQSSKIGTIPFSTEYVDDPTLPSGTTQVKQAGSNGCKSQTYKILYKDGVEVSRTLINTDTYKPHNQVIARGTKIISTPEPTVPTTPETPEQPVETQTPSVTVTTDVPAE